MTGDLRRGRRAQSELGGQPSPKPSAKRGRHTLPPVRATSTAPASVRVPTWRAYGRLHAPSRASRTRRAAHARQQWTQRWQQLRGGNRGLLGCTDYGELRAVCAVVHSALYHVRIGRLVRGGRPQHSRLRAVMAAVCSDPCGGTVGCGGAGLHLGGPAPAPRALSQAEVRPHECPLSRLACGRCCDVAHGRAYLVCLSIGILKFKRENQTPPNLRDPPPGRDRELSRCVYDVQTAVSCGPPFAERLVGGGGLPCLMVMILTMRHLRC